MTRSKAASHSPYVVDRVNAAMHALAPAQHLLLVAHSNVGRLVPTLLEHAGRPVSGCIFVDAALAAVGGATPIATDARLEELRAMAVAGRLPRWTEWWHPEEVARLLPDPSVREAVAAEQPSLPLAFYEQVLPQPGHRGHAVFGYLLFGPPYEAQAADAVERGWLVEHEPGLHLHHVIDPDSVARRLVAMTQRLLPSSACSPSRLHS